MIESPNQLFSILLLRILFSTEDLANSQHRLEAMTCCYYRAKRLYIAKKPLPVYWTNFSLELYDDMIEMDDYFAAAIKNGREMVFDELWKHFKEDGIEALSLIDQVYGDGTLLHIAVFFKKYKFVERLLSEAPELINMPTTTSCSTALHICCIQQDEHCAKLLLNAGASITAVDSSGKTPDAYVKSKALKKIIQGSFH